MAEQIGLYDVEAENYAAFEDKFKPKLTTDDCYTFGFGRVRLHRLWDACLEYIHDIDEGLLNTEEMLACLKNEDGIVISWRVEI